jgi:predicted nucleic acid-binding protein
MLVLLDTTVLIDHLCGRPAVARVDRLLRDGATVATTAINVEEVVRGMRNTERGVVDDLLAGLVVVPIGEAAARQAGAWRAEYASRGTTLHQADCLIAAAAEVHGGRLCTGNPEDFPMISVEHWPVGE